MGEKDEFEGTREDFTMTVEGEGAEVSHASQSECEARQAQFDPNDRRTACEKWGHLPRCHKNGTEFDPRVCRTCGSNY